jgi:hypothetical protein
MRCDSCSLPFLIIDVLNLMLVLGLAIVLLMDWWPLLRATDLFFREILRI